MSKCPKHLDTAEYDVEGRCLECEHERGIEFAAQKQAEMATQRRVKKKKQRQVRKKPRKTAPIDEMTEQEKARREIANRELSKRHLLAFVKRYEPKYQAGWFHKLLCQELMQFLQDVIDEKAPRLIITVPPRHGKSLLASQYFPAWEGP